MKISPTPLTAALAGIFSAALWPVLWSLVGRGQDPGTIEVMLLTMLVIILPAHAFVMGFGYRSAGPSRSFDPALLKRVGVWLGAAAATALISATFFR